MARQRAEENEEPSQRGDRPATGQVAIAAMGDAVILLLFAAIGRASHGEQVAGAVMRMVGTAAPFLLGWFAIAPLLGVYAPRSFTSARSSMSHTGRAWIAGCLVGLAIRSALQHRIVPASFAAITLVFNLVLLLAWRSILLLVFRNASRRSTGSGEG